MKHTWKKVLALAVAVLMAAASLPLAVFAEADVSSADDGAKKPITVVEPGENNLDELELLLSMDDLTGANLWTKDETVTYEVSSYNQGETVVKDGAVYTEYEVTVSSANWMGYAGDTNLPLDDQSQYTIQFTAQLTDAAAGTTHLAFSFTNPGALNGQTDNHTMQGIYFGDNLTQYIYASSGMKWQNATSVPGSEIPNTLDLTKETVYTLAIDGPIVRFYADGVHIGDFDFSKDTEYGAYSGDFLALGLRARAKVSSLEEPFLIAKDYKVYSGVYESSAVERPNWEEGDLLLHMDTLNVGAESTDYDITLNQITPQNTTSGELADGMYSTLATPGRVWGTYGVTTNLPLSDTSKYTIEYYAKRPSAINTSMTYSYGANNNAQGLYVYAESFTTVHGYTSNAYGSGATTSFSGIWTNTGYQDADGYTRFCVEIDGTKATLYVGGVLAGSYDFSEPAAGKDVAEGYVSSNLSLVFKTYIGLAENGQLLCQVKNISVYGGNVMSRRSVSFEHNGSIIRTGYYEENEVITSFPEVEAAPGKQIVWYLKDTNVVVQAPYTVLKSVTICAREVDENETALVGLQKTDAVDNRVSLRFIGSTYNLKGAVVGFELTAAYTADGEPVVANWTRESSEVYTSINAAENGTVQSVTANELGGVYLFALVLDNVPTDAGDIVFTVRPYKVVDGEKLYGETVSVTLTNGAFAD